MNTPILFTTLRRSLKSSRIVLLSASLVVAPAWGQTEHGSATVGGRLSSDMAEAYLSIFAPISSSEDSILFLNPRLALKDEGESEGNFGIGYRKLFGDSAILGANFYADRSRTRYDNSFDQWGLGFELLTNNIDFRANYYNPGSDVIIAATADVDTFSEFVEIQKQIEEMREIERRLLNSRTSSTSSDFYRGNNLLNQTRSTTRDRYRTTTTDTKTTTTTTTTTKTFTDLLFEMREGGLEGYDLELGYKLPLKDTLPEVRIFGGYYDFEGPFDSEIKGAKGRLEVRAGDYLTFDAEIFEDEELHDTDYYVGARINMPFSFSRLFDGKNPFLARKDDLQRFRNRPLSERLGEEVLRDVNVKTAESEFEENIAKRQTKVEVDVAKEVDVDVVVTSRDSERVTRDDSETIYTNDGQAITFTHVDSNSTGTDQGTYENPNTSLTSASNTQITDANDVILIHADSNFDGESVDITDNQMLIGQGGGIDTNITTDQGTIVLPDANDGTNTPVITNGDININSHNVVVSNLAIDGGSISTAAGGHHSDITITNVSVANASGDAISLGDNGGQLGGTITLSDIVISDAGDDGIDIQNLVPDTQIVANNIDITGVGDDGLDIDDPTGSATNAALSFTNLAIANSGDAGITVSGLGANSSTEFVNTSISNSGTGGLRVSELGTDATMAFTNLDINSSVENGVQLTDNSGTLVFDADSSLQGSGEVAFLVQGGDSDVRYSGTIDHTGADGFEMIELDSTLAGSNIVFDSEAADALVDTNLGIYVHSSAGNLSITADTELSGIDGVFINNSSGDYAFTNTHLTDIDGTLDPDGSSDGAIDIFENTGTIFFGENSSVDQSLNLAAVAVGVNAAGDDSTFVFNGTINATNGNGLQFENADGSYTFGGATTLNGGNAGIDILNSSDGDFIFVDTDIIHPTGVALNINDGTANVTFGADSSITQSNNAAAVRVVDHATGTLTFMGDISATDGVGLRFNNADGTYNFGGNNTLNGGNAAVDIINDSDGAFTWTDLNILNPNGHALNINSGTATVTLGADSQIEQGNAFNALRVVDHSGGTVTLNGTINATNGNGILFNNADGTYALNGNSTLNGGNAALDIVNGSAGDFTIQNMDITNASGIGVRIQDLDGGNVNFINGSVATNATAPTVDINGGSGNINFLGSDVTQTGTGLVVDVTDFGNGSSNILFDASGSITATTAGNLGIRLNDNNANITLASANIANTSSHAVRSTNSSGQINLSNVDISNAGGDGVRIANLDGTLQFQQGSSIDGAAGNGIHVIGGGAATEVQILGTSGATDIANVGGDGIAISNTTGTVTISDIDTQNVGGLAFDLNNTGAVSVTSGLTFADIANGRFINQTGTHNIVNASLTTLLVNGGNADINLTNTTFTNNTTDPTLTVTNGHSGSIIADVNSSFNTTNGTGFQFSNADGVYTFNGTNIFNGGDAGINIVNDSAGNFTFGVNSSITNPSGVAFNVNNSSATVNYNGTITQNNAASAVNISNNTGGAVTFGGQVTANTSTANAVRIVNNTNTTSLNGGLNIDTTSGIGLRINNGGTVNVSNVADESITTESGTALSVTGAGSVANLALDSINGTNLGGNDGIVIDNTGGGDISVGSIDLTGGGIDIDNHAGTLSVSGTTNITGAAASAIDINNIVNNITFGDVNIGGSVNGNGISLSNIDVADIDLTFGNVNIGQGAADFINGHGIAIAEVNANGTSIATSPVMTFGNTNIDHYTGSAISVIDTTLEGGIGQAQLNFGDTLIDNTLNSTANAVDLRGGNFRNSFDSLSIDKNSIGGHGVFFQANRANLNIGGSTNSGFDGGVIQGIAAGSDAILVDSLGAPGLSVRLRHVDLNPDGSSNGDHGYRSTASNISNLQIFDSRAHGVAGEALDVNNSSEVRWGGNTFSSDNNAAVRITGAGTGAGQRTLVSFVGDAAATASGPTVVTDAAAGGILIENASLGQFNVGTFGAPDLVIGSSSNRVSGPGLSLTNVNTFPGTAGFFEVINFGELDIFTDGGTGLLVNNSALTPADLELNSQGGTVDTVNGAAIDLTNVSFGGSGFNLDSVISSDSTNNGIALSGLGGGTFNTTQLTASGADVAAIRIQGTNTSTINLGDVDLTISDNNVTGLDISGAIINGDLSASDFDVTASSSTGTTAINVVDASGSGVVQLGDTNTNGGENATIAGTNVGVLFSSNTNLAFTFGDGSNTSPDGIQSEIDATTPISHDGSGLPTNGTYDFNDVNLIGDTSTLAGPDVYYVDATGLGTGTSQTNAGSIAGAETSGADAIVLLDTNDNGTQDSIDQANAPHESGGLINSLELDDGQILISLVDGQTIDLGAFGLSGGAPANFETNVGSSSQITGDSSLDSVTAILTTNSGDTVVMNGSAVVNGNTITNTGTGNALSSTQPATNVTLQINNNTLTGGSNGAGLSIDGSGTGTVTITEFNGNNIRGAGGNGIDITDVTFDADLMTAGFQQVLAGNTVVGINAANRVQGDGVRLNNVLGDISFTNLNIFNDNGTGLYVRDAGGKTGTFSIAIAGGTVDTTNGTALDIDPVLANIVLGSVFSTNANGQGSSATNAGGVFLDGVDAQGGAGANAVTINNLAVTNSNDAGVNILNSTGAFTFNNAVINNTGSAGGGVDLDLGSGDTATVSFNGLDIVTNSGTGFDANGTAGSLLTLTTTGTNSINTATGQILNLNDVTLGNNVTFTNLTSSGSVANGNAIFLNLVVGNTLNGGNVTVAGTSNGDGIHIANSSTNTTFTSIDIDNVSANGIQLTAAADAGNTGSFTVSGLTDINGTGAGQSAIDISNQAGAVNFANVNINNRGGAGIAIDGFNDGSQDIDFGTVTINNQSSSNTSAIAIDNINGAGSTVDITNVAINGNGTGGAGIALSNNDGATININGGSIQNAGGAALSISNSAGDVTYAGTINNTAGRSVQILNNENGADITLSGAITDTGTGILVNSNNIGGNATVNFTGGMTLNTGANDAFTATNGGVINVTGTNQIGNASPVTNRAITITDTLIGTNGVTFQSVNQTGGGSAIVLSNTGSGAFNITGNGVTGGTLATNNNGSGGSITGSTGDAISLNNTGPVTLRQMNIGAAGGLGNIGGSGVRANAVNGLIVANTNFRNVGNQAAPDEAAIFITAPSTSSNVTLANNLFNRSFDDHVRIENQGNVLGTISVTQNNFDDNTASGVGNDALLYIGNNGSNTTLNVTGNRFHQSAGDHIQVGLNGSASATVNIGGPNAADGNTMTANLNTVLGSGITLSSGASGGGFSGTLNYLIQNNSINNANAAAINLNLSATSTATALYTGSILNNQIGTAGSPESAGFGITLTGNGSGTLEAIVNNNTIQEHDGDFALTIQARDGNNTVAVSAANNTFRNTTNVTGFGLIGISAGATATDAVTVCVDLQNNDFAGQAPSAGGGADFFIREGTGTNTLILPGYAGGATDNAAVTAFIQGQNTGTPTGFVSSGDGITGTACP
ncbi:hypothetical protein GCM10008090_24020 [Arenicella chitinivorans]|uniref:Inverse autotransporter beta-domain domain-containing protein n=1 Tax=Arenicella chitinivorans TaxID=1329800 RepID=A0A918RUS6_9GAMM|nr:hypothetical protein [Arenicella chitinivorans]GHA13481.1 hypothetical protein GCM10008090_24020 [Arenicella chitinivorans]